MIYNKPEYYKKYGVRFLYDFISPKINDPISKQLSRNSNYHYVSFLPTELSPDDNDILFPSNSKIPMENIIEMYAPIGTVRNSSGSPQTHILNLKKRYRKFKMVEKGDGSSSKSTIPVVYNYGLLNTVYNYTPSNQLNYFEWYNIYNTFIKKLDEVSKVSERQNYVDIYVDNIVPSIQNLRTHSKKHSTKISRLFTTPFSLFVLDVWRWLDPKTREESILNNLSPDILHKTTLIFNRFGNWITLDLSVLMGFVNNNGYYDRENRGNKTQTITVDKVQKLFIALLHKIRTITITKDLITLGATYIEVIEEGTLGIDDILSEADDINEDSDKNSNIVSTDVDEDGITESPTDFKNTNKTIDDIKNIIYTELTMEDKVRKDIEYLSNTGTLSTLNKKKAIKLIDSQGDKKSPYDDKYTITEYTDIKEEDLILRKNIVPLLGDDRIPDKRILKASLKDFDERYIKDILPRDNLNAVLHMQNSGILVEDHIVDVEEDILNKFEVHKLKIKPIDGDTVNISLRVPKLNSRGEYLMGGNKYMLRKQLVDKPIRKISSTRVSLNSPAYGKLNIDKALLKKNDVTSYLSKTLIKLSSIKDSVVKDFIPGDVFDNLLDAPMDYSVFSKICTRLQINDRKYIFRYKDRFKLYGEERIKQLEKNGSIVVGKEGPNPITINRQAILHKHTKDKVVEIEPLMEQLGIDIRKVPVEFTTLKIYKKAIPIGIILGSYIGLNNLIKMLDIAPIWRDLPDRKRLDKYQWSIVFSNKKLIMDRRDKLATLVLGGFRDFSHVLVNYVAEAFNNPDVYLPVMESKGISTIYIKELELIKDLFLDRTTKETLKRMKEPTTIHGLMVRATELLMSAKHPNKLDSKQQLLLGHERVAIAINRELIKATREYKYKRVFGRAKFSVHPLSVWIGLSKDSSVAIVSNINPIDSLKLHEDVTYTGTGGRSKETMTRETRAYDKSDLGIISEASKDSGEVGITTYLAANPNITNLRGELGEFDFKRDGGSSLLSTSNMMAPETTSDDSKRMGFVSIQNSHVIAIKDMELPYVRTPFQSTFPYMVGPEYATHAISQGKVTDINDSHIVITYADGTEVRTPLGFNVGSSEGTLYPQPLETNLKKGDVVKEGDVISYNPNSFEIDPYSDNKKLIYRNSKNVVIGLVEDKTTHEDSCMLSDKISNSFHTNIIHGKPIIVEFTKHITEPVKIGETVVIEQILMYIEDDVSNRAGLFDKDSVDVIKGLKRDAPVINYSGIIRDIKVRYHGDKGDMTPSLKTIADSYDRRLKRLRIEQGEKVVTGKVNSDYRIKGKAIPVNTMEITYFVDVEEGMGVGDKIIFGNQLKATVAEVFNYPMITDSGVVLDGFFGSNATEARIVNSFKRIGTTTTLLKVIAKQATDIYFK